MASVTWGPGGEFYIADSFDRAGELSYCTATMDSCSTSEYAINKGINASLSCTINDFRDQLTSIGNRVSALEGGCARSCAAETTRFKSAWRYNRRAFKTLAKC